ncbi:hypothetical protein C8F01DRAFT_1085398 [Mycena amicta]|nr:hypothetical protein C8F01DRAFT_1085398 [Mycena amicta]
MPNTQNSYNAYSVIQIYSYNPCKNLSGLRTLSRCGSIAPGSSKLLTYSKYLQGQRETLKLVTTSPAKAPLNSMKGCRFGYGRQFTSFGGCDGTKCRPAALVPTDWAAAQGGRGRQFEDSGRQLWELCDTVGGSWYRIVLMGGKLHNIQRQFWCQSAAVDVSDVPENMKILAILGLGMRPQRARERDIKSSRQGHAGWTGRRYPDSLLPKICQACVGRQFVRVADGRQFVTLNLMGGSLSDRRQCCWAAMGGSWAAGAAD